MRARTHLLGLLLVVACDPGPLVLQVPFEAADRAAVLAVVTEGQTRYWAVDSAFRQMQPILQSVEGWTPATRVEVHVVYFADGLEALGLEPGAVTSVPSGVALPTGRRVLSAVLEGSDEVDWVARDSRPPALDALRIPTTTPCKRFSSATERWILDGFEAPLAFVEDPDGDLWLVTASGGFDAGRLRRMGETLEAPVEVPGRFRARAAVGVGGRVYLAGGAPGVGGQILAGVPGAELEVWATDPGTLSSDWPTRVAALAGAASPTLYTVSATGTLARYTAGAVTRLADLGHDGTHGDLSAAAFDEVYVVPPDGSGVFRFADGAATMEATAIDSDIVAGRDLIESIAVIPGYGAFAGSDGGFLLRRAGSQWDLAAPNTLISSTIEAMIPFGDGMLVTGRYGIVDQRFEGLGYCESERLFVGMNLTITAIAVHGDRVAIAGFERIDSSTRQYFAQWVVPAEGSRD